MHSLVGCTAFCIRTYLQVEELTGKLAVIESVWTQRMRDTIQRYKSRAESLQARLKVCHSFAQYTLLLQLGHPPFLHMQGCYFMLYVCMYVCIYVQQFVECDEVE